MIHIAQRDGAGGIDVAGDVRANHSVEGKVCAVVRIEPARLVPISGDDVQITVPIQIGENNRAGIAHIGRYIEADDPGKGVRGAVVQVQPVRLIKIARRHIQIAVIVHIPHRHGIRKLHVRRKVYSRRPLKGILRAGVQVIAVDPPHVARDRVQQRITIQIRQQRRFRRIQITAHRDSGNPIKRIRRARVEKHTMGLVQASGEQIHVAIVVHIPGRQSADRKCLGGNGKGGNPGKGIGSSIVEKKLRNRGVIPRRHIQQCITIPIRHRHRIGGAISHTHARHAAERLGRSIVDVKAHPRVTVSRNQIQVPVGGHVGGHQGGHRKRIGGYACARNPLERICGAVIQIQAVGLSGITRHKIKMSIIIEIAQNHPLGREHIG